MKAFVRHGMVLAATIAGIGSALAQIDTGPTSSDKRIVDPKSETSAPAQLRLTDEQKSAIAAAVSKDNKVVTPPPSFVVQVGAPVPPAIELYILPDSTLAAIPAAKSVKYTVINDQLILVDPTTMRVVDVIKK